MPSPIHLGGLVPPPQDCGDVRVAFPVAYHYLRYGVRMLWFTKVFQCYPWWYKSKSYLLDQASEIFSCASKICILEYIDALFLVSCPTTLNINSRFVTRHGCHSILAFPSSCHLKMLKLYRAGQHETHLIILRCNDESDEMMSSGCKNLHNSRISLYSWRFIIYYQRIP